MTWKTVNGQLQFVPDGIGNPNIPGDNSGTTSVSGANTSGLGPGAQALLTAASSAASGGSASTSASALSAKDIAAARVDNTQLGLKDSSGKSLGPTITAAQTIQALTQPANAKVAEQIRMNLVKNYPNGLAGITKLGPTGTPLTPAEANAFLNNVVKVGYANEPITAPLNINSVINNLQSNAYLNQNITTKINETTLNQPSLQASTNVVNNLFMSLLGRTATQQEIQNYAQQYINYAAANPQSNTSGEYSYGTVTTGSGAQRLMRQGENLTTKTNDLTEQQYVQNQIEAAPDFKAQAAANTAYNFLKTFGQQNMGVA